jgi:hypothetical protein
MPTITVDTTAQQIPAGGYRNATNVGAVPVYIESDNTVSSTTSGVIQPNGTFNWSRDYPRWWVRTASGTCDLRIT